MGAKYKCSRPNQCCEDMCCFDCLYNENGDCGNPCDEFDCHSFACDCPYVVVKECD